MPVCMSLMNLFKIFSSNPIDEAILFGSLDALITFVSFNCTFRKAHSLTLTPHSTSKLKPNKRNYCIPTTQLRTISSKAIKTFQLYTVMARKFRKFNQNPKCFN